MTFPPLKVVLVMYGTAIGVLWASALVLAPSGYNFRWWRAVVAAILMTASSKLLRVALSPVVGDWYALALFPTYVVLVRIVLLLPFWRSVLAAGIYIGVVAAVYSLLFAKPAT